MIFSFSEKTFVIHFYSVLAGPKLYTYTVYIYIHTTYIPEIQDRYRKYQRLNGEVHFPTKASFFCYPFFNFWLKLCNLILSPKKQLHSDVSLPRPNPLGDTGRSAGRLITPRKELSDLQNLDWFVGSNLPKKHKLGVFLFELEIRWESF